MYLKAKTHKDKQGESWPVGQTQTVPETSKRFLTGSCCRWSSDHRISSRIMSTSARLTGTASFSFQQQWIKIHSWRRRHQQAEHHQLLDYTSSQVGGASSGRATRNSRTLFKTTTVTSRLVSGHPDITCHVINAQVLKWLAPLPGVIWRSLWNCRVDTFHTCQFFL